MYNLKFFLRVFLCFFLVSCQSQYTKNKIILHAEAIVLTYPDSAFRLLTAIPHPEKLSKADHAAWCLQYSYAQYKLNKNIKSDRIIRVAVNYYEKSSFRKQSGTANYLLGCILQNNNKNKEAMSVYKKAEYTLKSTEDKDLKGLVDFKIGYLYMLDEIFNESLIYFKKSLNYFISTKNLKYQAYSYRIISDIYYQLNYPFQSVMNLSNQALKLSKQSGDSTNYYSILGQQGELLFDKNYALAKEYLLKGYNYFPLLRPNYASLLAYTYIKLNNPDSANYYVQISMMDTTQTKYNVGRYFTGAYVAKYEGDKDKAFILYEKAYSLRNEFFKQSVISQLHIIDKQFDVTKSESEKAVLKIDNRNKVIVISLLIIVVMAGLIIFLIVHNRNKKKQVEDIIEKQVLKKSLEVKKSENNLKKQLLLSKLTLRMENTLQFNRLKMGLSRQVKLDDFIKEISIQSIVSQKDWEFYIQEVDHIFDKKISSLSSANSQLTQSDIRVIVLICLRMDISDCCNLLNLSKETMYHRRAIIKKRIGLNVKVDLEKWVWELMEGEITENDFPQSVLIN